MRPGDEQARDRPHSGGRLIIHGFEHTRTLQRHVHRSRGDRAPADRFISRIRQHAGLLIIHHQFAKSLAVFLALAAFPGFAGEPPRHAPASAAGAALAKECFEVIPALRRQRMKCQARGALSGGLHNPLEAQGPGDRSITLTADETPAGLVPHPDTT